jgi:hypothetical protein
MASLFVAACATFFQPIIEDKIHLGPPSGLGPGQAIHEVAQSKVNRGGSEWSSRNTADIYLLNMSINLYGLVDEIRVPRVSLK